eukprot:8566390-Pyramimonas_sp.AAC.1
MDAFLGKKLDYGALGGAVDQTYEILASDLTSFLSKVTDTPLRSQRLRGQGPQLRWVPACAAERARRRSWRSLAGPLRWLKNKITDARRALDQACDL